MTPTYQCNQCVTVRAALGLDILLPAHCFLFLKKKETSLHAIGLLGPDVRQLGELGLWSGPLYRYGDRRCDGIAGIVEMLVRDRLQLGVHVLGCRACCRKALGLAHAGVAHAPQHVV